MVAFPEEFCQYVDDKGVCGRPGAKYRADLEVAADYYCDEHYAHVKGVEARVRQELEIQ